MNRPHTTTTSHRYGANEQVRVDGFEYYENGLLRSVTREPFEEALRQETYYERDPSNGNVVTVRVMGATMSREELTRYDMRGRYPVAHTNAMGHVTEVQHDQRTGALLTTMDPNRIVRQWRYDDFGRVVGEFGPVETVDTQYQKGYLESQEVGQAPPGGLTILKQTHGGGRTKWDREVLDPDGRVIWRRIDGAGGEEVVERIDRDWAGRVIRADVPHALADSSQGEYTLEYDSLGRVRTEVLPDGRQRHHSHVTRTSARGGAGEVFDALSDENAVWAHVIREPEGRGRVTVTSGSGAVVGTAEWEGASPADIGPAFSGAVGAANRYRYAPFGLVASVLDPDGEETTIEHDKIGRRTALRNPTTGSKTYSYDEFDRVSSETDSNGTTRCAFYDSLGRIVDEIRGEQGECSSFGEVAAHYEYDGWDDNEVGRLVSSFRQARPGAGVGTTTRYRYEPRPSEVLANAGRIAAVEVDVPGAPQTFTTTLGYDGSLLRTVHYPSVGGDPFAVRFEYDSTGVVVAAADQSAIERGEVPTLFWRVDSFDQGLRIQHETFGNGVSTAYAYYAPGESGVDCGGGGSEMCMPGAIRTLTTTRLGMELPEIIRHYEYNYDAAGNLVGVNDSGRSREIYGYDGLNRLTSHAHNAYQGTPIWRMDWQYGPGGDPTLQSKTNGRGEVLWAYNPEYEPTRPHLMRAAGGDSFEYDGRGNQVRRIGDGIPNLEQVLSYNELDLPFSIGGGVDGDTQLEYDAGRNRVAKRGPHRTQITIGEHYECDGETPANPDGVLECETERFRIAIGGRVVAVAIRGAAFGTELQYLHGDHLGSPRVITNSTGGVVEERDFTAFGGPLFDFSATTVSSGFTGHRHDAELGLVNMRGRLYDPMVGRFVSPDPFVTDPFSSQGMNRYSYVQNRPLSFVDPSGFTGEGGPCGGGAKNFVVPNPYPINRGEATFAPTMGSVIPPPPPQFFVFPCPDDERRRTGPVGSSSPAGVPEPIAPSPPGAPPTGDPSPPPAPGGNGGASGGPSSGGVAGSAPSGAQGGGAAGQSGSPNGSPGYTQGSMANGSNIPNAPNRPGTNWGPGVNGGVGSVPWIGWEPPPSRSGPLQDSPLNGPLNGPLLFFGVDGEATLTPPLPAFQPAAGAGGGWLVPVSGSRPTAFEFDYVKYGLSTPTAGVGVGGGLFLSGDGLMNATVLECPVYWSPLVGSVTGMVGFVGSVPVGLGFQWSPPGKSFGVTLGAFNSTTTIR